MTQQPETDKRNLLWLWIGLAVVIVLAAGVAISTSGDDAELSVGSVPASVGSDGSGGAVEPAEVWPVTVTGTALPGLEDPADDPAVGRPAPQLSGSTFDGSPVTVDPSKGPVMLVFLAHWCPHCNREVPELLAWDAAGEVPEGLQVIAVTTAVDPKRDFYPPSEWIADKQWDWPVLADSQGNDAAAAMGVTGFPFSVLIGADGTVLGRISGELGQAGIDEWVGATLSASATN